MLGSTYKMERVGRLGGPLRRFLVVEDDRPFARSLARYLRGFGRVSVVHTVSDALARLDEGYEYAGFVLDVGLPDSSGLELLRLIRERGHDTPALVLTGHDEADVIAAAQLHHATFLCKPASQENLFAFVQWTKEHRRAAERRLRDAVRDFGDRHALTPREEQLLLLSASGTRRSELGAALGVTEATVKTLVRRLLQRTQRADLADVVADVHHGVFHQGASEQ